MNDKMRGKMLINLYKGERTRLMQNFGDISGKEPLHLRSLQYFFS